MKHRVSVEQKHIDRGVPSTDSLCPIALAMGSLGLKEVSVSGGMVWYISENYDNVFKCVLPKEAKQFMHDFDDRKEVKPFIFETHVVKCLT